MIPLRYLVILSILAGLASACRVGWNPARSPAATSPRGVDVVVETSTPTVFSGPATRSDRGELLACRDDGILVVLDDGIVLFTPGSFDRVLPGVKRSLPERMEDAEDLSEWCPYSRHPYGLSEAHLARLLSIRGQDSLEVRRR